MSHRWRKFVSTPADFIAGIASKKPKLIVKARSGLKCPYCGSMATSYKEKGVFCDACDKYFQVSDVMKAKKGTSAYNIWLAKFQAKQRSRTASADNQPFSSKPSKLSKDDFEALYHASKPSPESSSYNIEKVVSHLSEWHKGQGHFPSESATTVTALILRAVKSGRFRSFSLQDWHKFSKKSVLLAKSAKSTHSMHAYYAAAYAAASRVVKPPVFVMNDPKYYLWGEVVANYHVLGSKPNYAKLVALFKSKKSSI